MDDNRLKRAFGEAMRKARQAKGISQEALADLAGIHRTYVGDVERGERNIALVNMFRIAVSLDLPLSKLLRNMERNL